MPNEVIFPQLLKPMLDRLYQIRDRCNVIQLHSVLGWDWIPLILLCPIAKKNQKGCGCCCGRQIPSRIFAVPSGAETTSAEHLARALNKMGQSTVGASGFSSVGVVVGAMAAEEAQRIRDWLPHAWFLVPGMGAQGGSAEMALAGSGGDGLGSLVVCSRSLLYPKVEGDLFETETENCIRQAILETKQSLDDVLKPKIKARLRQQEQIAKNKDVTLLLKNAQERFEGATEKEHWEKLKILLCSEDKESVVQGMNLLETLDEDVYYDGVCSFLKDDGKGTGC